MSRTAVIRLGLAVALSLSPATALAQDGESSPEGVEWHLVSYTADGSARDVPWFVDASLTLEGGTATGRAGCDRFSTSYALEGAALSFEPTAAMTRRICPDPQATVGDGYLARLPEVASWDLEEGVLTLADDAGAPLLELESAVATLSASDVAAIEARFADQQAQLDRLDERLDSVRIGLLRERIRTLEDQVTALQVATAATGGAPGATFDRAESTLLQGIPPNVRRTCTPLRGGSLPNGTLAAVRCTPAAAVVSEMAYYLMPYRDAERTFRRVMRDNGVPRRFECSFGRASQVLQSPYNATGCFVDGGGRANVRLVTWAADCHELDVGGSRLSEPAVYIALESDRRRIRPLYDWATNPDEFVLEPVWIDIPHGGTPTSPGCRGLAP